MKTFITQKMAKLLLPLTVFFGILSPVFVRAESSVNATAAVSIPGAKAEAKVEAKADAAATMRINSLTALKARISAMKNVNDSAKASLSASLDSTIASLTTLKAKIADDTSAADMRADAQAMVNTNRVYMLVIPQARIAAAADRAGTVGDMMTALSAKLQARIDAAKAAGKDVTSISSLQADMTAKVADAKVQAAAAVTASATLTPDNGEKTKAAANEAALKTARADLKAAETDLKAAREDIRKIVAALKGFHLDAGASAKVSQ